MEHILAFSSESQFELNEALSQTLSQAILRTLAYESVGFCAEVSVLFVENEAIRELNATYRGKDRETDVLSFPLYDSREEIEADVAMNSLAHAFALGDVVIAADVVKVQAEQIGEPFERHLCRMCIHSVLHLLGYDHELGEEQDVQMMQKQEEILDSLSLQ